MTNTCMIAAIVAALVFEYHPVAGGLMATLAATVAVATYFQANGKE